MKISLRFVLCSLLLLLFACRQDIDTSASTQRWQGVYQKRGATQMARDCATGKWVRLQDTPDQELRRQCSLFDHPENTRLWLDLEGVKPSDSIFVVQRILKIERREMRAVCR